MNGEDSREDRDRLAQAQETIVQQAKEIERLRSKLMHAEFAEELQKVLTLASTAATLAAPVTHSRLLEMIVSTAAHVISAQAASLFLIDEKTEELMFEVALGQKAEEVKKFRVPLGRGFVGLVAVSGQPMAVSDVQSNPQHASDIAQAIDYVPKNLLCVPLFYNDQIIGVIELLDKEGASSFSPEDMEILGLFANQAAIAIAQSRTRRNLGAFVREMLNSFTEVPDEQRQRLQQGMDAFAADIEEDIAYQQALDLARLVREIAWRGDQEYKACRTILRGFADYLQTRMDSANELEITLW